MIDVDMSDMRETTMELAPHVDFDVKATFYHDETNNIKKFYVREADFNESFTANFVLGGLLHKGAAPNIQPLINSLRLQPTIKEIKFKHIAKGGFLECLQSKNLKAYLKFVEESDLYIHYSSVNILYWSIVDIVDSAIVGSGVPTPLGLEFVNRLKNDLYKLSRLEIDSLIDLFYRYTYPNIAPDTVLPFIEDLTSLFDGYIDTVEFHLGLETLRQILKGAKRTGDLPFITGEKEDRILLKDFSTSYLHPVCMFKNSTHIFDNEGSISEIFEDYRLLDNGKEFKNYSFTDSQSNVFIQLSDVFVGLMGKLSIYSNTTQRKQIRKDLNALSQIQRDNLSLLKAVIDKSLRKNAGFIHRTDSHEEMDKVDNLILA